MWDRRPEEKGDDETVTRDWKMKQTLKLEQFHNADMNYN